MKNINYYMKKAKKIKTQYALLLLLEDASNNYNLTLDEFTTLNDYIESKLISIIF